MGAGMPTDRDRQPYHNGQLMADGRRPGTWRIIRTTDISGHIDLGTVIINDHIAPPHAPNALELLPAVDYYNTVVCYDETSLLRETGGCMGDRAENRRVRRARGALEREILAALWAADEPVAPAVIQQSLGGDLAYTTVTTILTRLAEKGLAERIPTGRGYAWRALAAREELAAQQMKALLGRGETPTAVLQRFVEQLSPAEGAALRSLLAAQPPPADE